MENWKLEDNVNDWVKSEFSRINQQKYTVESSMSKYLKSRNQTMPESWAASHLVATCSLGLKASALEATGGCSTGDQP